jgi:hypothetical protein
MTDPTPDGLEPLDAYGEALRRVQSSGPRASAPKHYPYRDGESVVLGPGVFASSDRTTINWQGANYVMQDFPAPTVGTVPSTDRPTPQERARHAARTTPDNPATSSGTADSLQQRIARAIHRYDNHHALSGNDIPSKHHHGEADAVLAELKRELEALAEYENTINWHTTCTSCARILDSAIRETERAERAEAALREVLAVAEVIDANGIKWAADSIRRAATLPPAPDVEKGGE